MRCYSLLQRATDLEKSRKRLGRYTKQDRQIHEEDRSGTGQLSDTEHLRCGERGRKPLQEAGGSTLCGTGQRPTSRAPDAVAGSARERIPAGRTRMSTPGEDHENRQPRRQGGDGEAKRPPPTRMTHLAGTPVLSSITGKHASDRSSARPIPQGD